VYLREPPALIMTIWICGTSVSISPGYTTYLEEHFQPDQIEDISIGNQSSFMGLVRAHQHKNNFRPKDILIWEYPLLDILFEPFYGSDGLLGAMEEAWLLARSKGVKVIVAISLPKSTVQVPSSIEQRIADLAAHHRISVVNLRDSFASCGMLESAESYYVDDRHSRKDCLALKDFSERIVAAANAKPVVRGIRERFHKPRWQWRGADQFGATETFSNSLLTIDAIRLSENSRIDGFKAERAFACIVASEETGAIWCGHQYCPPVGTRKLKSTIPWSLQLCRIYCVRNDISQIVRAPNYAIANSQIADYGAEITPSVADVLFSGILFVPPDRRSPAVITSFFSADSHN